MFPEDRLDDKTPAYLDGYYGAEADHEDGAQLYAIGVEQLADRSLPSSITLQHFANTRLAGSPGFTVWPATSFPGEHSTEAGDRRPRESMRVSRPVEALAVLRRDVTR